MATQEGGGHHARLPGPSADVWLDGGVADDSEDAVTAALVAAAILFLSMGRVDKPTADKWADKIVHECAIESERIVHGRKMEVDPLVVVSMFRGESNFIPSMVNKWSGAMGLGQVMPFQKKRRKRELLNPLVNIEYSVRIYAAFLHICDHAKDPRSGAVSKYNGMGVCKSTPWSRYILAFRRQLEGMGRCPTTLKSNLCSRP